MAETIYNYTISTDTLNAAAAPSVLQNEINLDATVTIGVRGLSVAGDSLDITMMDALSGAQKTALDAVIAAHAGVEDPDAGADVVHARVSEHREGTGEHYDVRPLAFDVAASSEDHIEIAFDYPIRLNTLHMTARNDGDSGYMTIGGDGGLVIGNITANITAGDTVINVSQTAVDNIDVGYCLHLSDGTNTEEGRVVAKDVVNKTLTLKAGTTNAYLAATPTYCAVIVRLGYEDLEFDANEEIIFGAYSQGGPLLAAGTKLRLYYNNTGGSQVRVRAKLEYWY